MDKQVSDKKTTIILFISTLAIEKIVKESLEVSKNRGAKIFFIRSEYRMFPTTIYADLR
jgi:hypothetical protein